MDQNLTFLSNFHFFTILHIFKLQHHVFIVQIVFWLSTLALSMLLKPFKYKKRM